jgi:hypothetical protein
MATSPSFSVQNGVEPTQFFNIKAASFAGTLIFLSALSTSYLNFDGGKIGNRDGLCGES